jgi:hypothetical protein
MRAENLHEFDNRLELSAEFCLRHKQGMSAVMISQDLPAEIRELDADWMLQIHCPKGISEAVSHLDVSFVRANSGTSQASQNTSSEDFKNARIMLFDPWH